MSAYSDKVLLDGAAFYWRLGESAGTTAVDQKGILNGTYNGPTIGQAGALTVSGDTDTSALFGPANAEVAVAADSRHQALSQWTAEAWVYPTAPAPNEYQNIVSHVFNTNLPLILAQDPSSVGSRFFAGFYPGGWHQAYDPVVPPLNTWTHYVATYDGTTLCIYRNGVQAGSAATGGWAAASAASALRIGRKWDSGASFLGRIDEVALYPTALSAAQVLAHYTAGTTSAAPPQTVSVPGCYPPGFVASITGQVVSGDGHLVGGSTAAQFGALTAYNGSPKTAAVTGLGSAQSFGTVIPRLLTVPQVVPIGGLSSAQAFGVSAVATRITVAVPGLGPVGIQTSITGQVICGDGHVVGGFNPYFGAITPVMNVTLPTVPEAGLRLGSYAVTYTLSQAPNPQPAGLLLGTSTVDAYQVFLWDSICIDEDLAVSVCADIDLDSPAAVEVDLVLAPTR